MAGLSDYTKNKLLDWWFRGQTFTVPDTCYWRLFTANPNWETGAGGTELSAAGYAQYGQGITMAGWWSVATQGSKGGYRLTNTGTCSWTCGSDWAAITGIGLYDGNTSGANLLFGGAWSVNPGGDDTVRIAAGAIDIDFDVTTKFGFTSYTNQQMAKKLGADTTDTPLSAQYLALYTVAPDIKTGASGTEVETSGTAYTRKNIVPADDWDVATAKTVQNTVAFVWPRAAAPLGKIVAAAIIDTPLGTPSKYLSVGEFAEAEVGIGRAPYIADHAFDLAFISTPPPPEYGCDKPETTETLTNYSIAPGTHDVTYSYVRFAGYTGSGEGSTAVVRMQVGAEQSPCYNITFDHCVFATLPPVVNGNAFHMWNYNASAPIHHITFSHCWFEPQPRMVIELNGRGGWWHDVVIDHCTFEPGGGQMISADMSPDGNNPSSPYGVNVGGVVRGVEGLVVTNNDFRGTGLTVNGFAPAYKIGCEFGCVYPYASDTSVGRSSFTGNRVARCASAWFNCDYSGAQYMTFADNVFDWSYNPADIAGSHDPAFVGTDMSHCAFTDNTWVLGTLLNEPWHLLGDSLEGSYLTFVRESWTKPSGGMSLASFPFEDSTYTDCQFHLPITVNFPDSATGTGCVFDNGHTGGTFT